MRKSTVARWFGTVLTAGLMAATVPALTSTVPPAGAYPFPYWPQSPYSGWYRIVNQNSGRCLDARGGNSADGTAVQQYVCNGTASQDFELVPTSDGYFKIVVRLAPNPALSVAYGSLVNQAPVELRGYANGADQQWQVDRQSDGYYHFVARHSSRCLDVPGGSTANALQLQQYTCNGTVSQSFSLVQDQSTDSLDPNAWYTLVNRGSGKCVDARGGDSSDGAVVQQYTCNGTGSQSFQFAPTGDGYYRISVHLVPNPVLDVTDGVKSNGALVQLWQYYPSQNQQWKAVSEGGGNYHFVARHSGRCLDVPGASADNSVQLQQYDCNNSVAQSFVVGR